MQNALILALFLLAVGVLLRARVRVFQVLYIPASILGGLIGLAAGPSLLGWVPSQVVENLGAWPGWLIAVIFAGLFLDRPPQRLGRSLRGAVRQGIMVWIIVFGQAAWGILLTWLLIADRFPVPYSFGQLIEAGFAGGHGTAAALGQVYQAQDFQEGPDLAFLVATVGLIYGVVSGIVLVNIGVRRGWHRGGGTVQIPLLSGMEARKEPTPVMYGRIRSEVLDPLAFQLVLLGSAFAGGVGLHLLLNTLFPFLERLPLFIFTLLAGFALRQLLGVLGLEDLLDPEGIRRISGTAMDFLIVSAIASLNLYAVAQMLLPVSLLLLMGFVYVLFCLLVLAPRLLPRDYWFELGLINYGMSTGTTATGLMLLRIIDSDFRSPAPADYALAAPLSAPFIGGGIVTFTLPFLMERVSAGIVAGAMFVILFLLYVVGRFLASDGQD